MNAGQLALLLFLENAQIHCGASFLSSCGHRDGEGKSLRLLTGRGWGALRARWDAKFFSEYVLFFSFFMKPFPRSKWFLTSALAAGMLVSGSANAATGSCNLTDLPSCTMTLEGITYSNFSFSGFTAVPPGVSEGDVFNLSGAVNGSGTVTLSFTPDRIVDIPNGVFSYTVTLDNRYFNKAQANLTGSTLGGGSLETALSAPGLPNPATSIGGPGGIVPFDPNLMTQTITQTFQYDFLANPDTLSAVGGSFTSVPVPGPLPVLAAGTAFGFSRKLRQRIKLIA